MNWMLEKWGSVAVLVSLRTIFPLAASATYKSIEKNPRDERNASHRPSGLIDGPTFRSVRSVARITIRPASPGVVVDANTGSYARRIASCQSFDSSFVVRPVMRLIAMFTSPADAASDNICRITSSPNRPPTYAQNAWPHRYGKYFGLSRSSIVGSFS